MKRYALFLIAFAFIIPNLDWRIWLSMFPELKEIAIAESRLNPNAVHINKNGTRDCGLFQINDVHGISCYKRKDPYFSLAWAIEKYYAGELKIWSTYKLLVKQGKLIEEL